MYRSHKFLESALTQDGFQISTAEVSQWIEEQRAQVNVQVDIVPLDSLQNWSHDPEQGQIIHESGAFFTIPGIEVETNWGGGQRWTQPIIKQAEIGYLGFLVKEFNGVLHFLMQAKIEPGNINKVQLSPTLQATRSNFTRAHKGKAPAFLNLFSNASAEDILLDQLQSEQGARFLRKRNRNILVKLEEEIDIPSNFIWLTLGQIKALMRQDNVVNMDSRTVVSGISFGNSTIDSAQTISFLASDQRRNEKSALILRSLLADDGSINEEHQIRSFLTDLKARHDLYVREIKLSELDEWNVSGLEIARPDRKYFRIIGAKVEIENREVATWTQPMVQPSQEGLCAMIGKVIDGVLHFAIQAKLECGNFDVVEFAPTVQCLTGNYRGVEQAPPFLDYALSVGKEQIWLDSMQSEEGGRFYREQNRNLVILAGDEVSRDLPPNYIWLTLSQIQKFIQFNNVFNIQARSLFAALSF